MNLKNLFVSLHQHYFYSRFPVEGLSAQKAHAQFLMSDGSLTSVTEYLASVLGFVLVSKTTATYLAYELAALVNEVIVPDQAKAKSVATELSSYIAGVEKTDDANWALVVQKTLIMLAHKGYSIRDLFAQLELSMEAGLLFGKCNQTAYVHQ
jgi:uncharacterized protein with von Willebrand factor type A (vWA) domain